ncbi:hypothetical protein OIU77_013317 [Salix suchowensis]|uniref:Uncharacterized protein n=1 Tax=Salix suchowensis TaxID=1278906 RepID=A0ABQ8ZTG1_9ROSI|nr:hypothetical protein IMY05_010G0177100 [Salix suchowensis]KAJ6311532.1 hypothetical protein OIU77_013317 [Salix suchowensis]KAJ6357929.1 hypothetical protein OIU78_005710 [Salix suchowensis]
MAQRINFAYREVILDDFYSFCAQLPLYAILKLQKIYNKTRTKNKTCRLAFLQQQKQPLYMFIWHKFGRKTSKLHRLIRSSKGLKNPGLWDHIHVMGTHGGPENAKCGVLILEERRDHKTKNRGRTRGW